MDLEFLKAFQQVAKEGSFSKAAQKLYRTQPAVSLAIKSLEEELGERLFLRLGKRVELTLAGQILLDYTKKTLDTLQKAKLKIEELRGLKAGRLVIGTSDTTGCYILPPVLQAFRERYPQIEIVVSNRPSPVILEYVLENAVDLGIVTLPVEHPKIVSEVLFSREDVVICSPGHPLAGRSSVRLKEFGQYPVLLLDKGSNTRKLIDGWLEDAGVVPHIVMELGSIELIKRFVEIDFGISIVPEVAVKSEMERGTLCGINIEDPVEPRKLGVIYLKGGYLTLAARKLLEILSRSVD